MTCCYKYHHSLSLSLPPSTPPTFAHRCMLRLPVFPCYMHSPFCCGVLHRSEVQNAGWYMTLCWSNVNTKCALKHIVSCAYVPLHALDLCANPFILHSMCVWAPMYACVSLWSCFLSDAALQSTSCILTQSLRHKWEHQNLSAVSHTVPSPERDEEGGREVGGGLTNLSSVSPSSSSNVCISPFLSCSPTSFLSLTDLSAGAECGLVEYIRLSACSF